MSFQVIAVAETSPKPSQIAYGISTALVTPHSFGMLLMAPAYLVAMGGLFLRTMAGEKPAAKV